jgi:hypothetical protein
MEKGIVVKIHVPIHHWNIKSAPASPGRSHVGPALYLFSLLGLDQWEYTLFIGSFDHDKVKIMTKMSSLMKSRIIDYELPVCEYGLRVAFYEDDISSFLLGIS